MAENKDIIIDFLQVAPGAHEWTYALDEAFFEALDQKEVLGGKVDAKVSIQASERTFKLHLQLEGQVSVTCDRCLDPVDEPVHAEDDILIKLAAEEGETDECICLNENRPLFDLGWLLFEEISVSLPIVCRHQPGECNPEMEKLLQAHLCTTVDEDEEKQ